MGCDIHIVLERLNDSNTWVGLKKMGYVMRSALDYPERDSRTYVAYRIKARDYDFFYAIAGVRGGNGPSIDPRGMPDDASQLSRLEFDDDTDLHSHS